MTLERIKGATVVECNGLGCHEFLEEETFEEARAAMRENGWTFEKIGTDWNHYCPDCSSRKPDLKKLMGE